MHFSHYSMLCRNVALLGCILSTLLTPLMTLWADSPPGPGDQPGQKRKCRLGAFEAIASGDWPARGVEISDDGKRIAFGATEDPFGLNPDGGLEIFLFDEALGALWQLTETSAAGFIRSFDLSGDGSVVVFSSTENPTGSNADLSEEVFLLETPDNVPQGAWTPVIEQISSGPASSAAQMPSVSADGDRVVFRWLTGGTAQNPENGGTSEVVLYVLSTLQLMPVTSFGRSVYFPKISGNGSRVAFRSTIETDGCQPDPLAFSPTDSSLWLMNLSSQSLHLLARGDLTTLEHAIDDTGRHVAFSMLDPDKALYVADANRPCNTPTKLLDLPTMGSKGLQELELSGDGRCLVFSSTNDPTNEGVQGVQVYGIDLEKFLSPISLIAKPFRIVAGRRLAINHDGSRGALLWAADTDNNGEIDLVDAVRILNFKFLGGARPVGLTEICQDDTRRRLGCRRYDACPRRSFPGTEGEETGSSERLLRLPSLTVSPVVGPVVTPMRKLR